MDTSSSRFTVHIILARYPSHTIIKTVHTKITYMHIPDSFSRIEFHPDIRDVDPKALHSHPSDRNLPSRPTLLLHLVLVRGLVPTRLYSILSTSSPPQHSSHHIPCSTPTYPYPAQRLVERNLQPMCTLRLIIQGRPRAMPPIRRVGRVHPSVPGRRGGFGLAMSGRGLVSEYVFDRDESDQLAFSGDEDDSGSGSKSAQPKHASE